MPTILERAEAKTRRAAELRTEIKALGAKDALTKDEDKHLAEILAEAKQADDEAKKLTDLAAELSANDTALDGYRQPSPRKTASDAGRDPLVAKPKFLEDPKRGFANQREYFKALLVEAKTHRADERLASLRPPELRATAGSDEQGAYSLGYGAALLPTAFSPELLTVPSEVDPTLGRTQIVPMETQVVNLAARVDKDHSTGSVSGGLKVYRRAEASTVTPSRMQFEQIELKAEPLMGVAFASEEILRRSPISFAALLQQGFNDEFAARRLTEILGGVGAGEFVGIRNAACLVSVAKETNQPADTLVYENIVAMRARCWRYANAIWLANHDTLPELMRMNRNVGTAGVPVWQTGADSDHPDTLMGRPIFFTEFCETLGDKGDIVLVNLSQYLEGILTPVEGASSIHVRFVEHETCFKFWMENCGAPWWRTALTPKKSAKTLSPFVTLDARA